MEREKSNSSTQIREGKKKKEREDTASTVSLFVPLYISSLFPGHLYYSPKKGPFTLVQGGSQSQDPLLLCSLVGGLSFNHEEEAARDIGDVLLHTNSGI